jgi:hypothetical protein
MSVLCRIGPGPLVFLALWLFLMAGGRSRLFRDPGTFWHTVVGERILTDGFFDTDPFSFTRHGKPWIPHQWLGEVSLALAHRVAGFDTQLLFAATVLAGLYTWLCLRLLRTGMHPILAIPVTAIGMAAGASHFHVRPHLFTIVALALTTGILTDFDSGRARLRQLCLLVPLFLIWSNIHGGMLGGLTTLVFVGMGWVTWAVIGCPSPFCDLRTAIRFAAVAGACALTVVVTPYGWKVAKAWLDIMGLDLAAYVEEHAPLNPAEPKDWPVVASAGLYLFVLAGVRERPRVTWLLPLFWLTQALAHVRHGSLFGVVALVAIADMWPATAWARRLAEKRADLYDPTAIRSPSAAWAWALPVLVVIATAALQVAGVPAPVVGAGWARLDPDRWPVAMLEAIRERQPTSAAPGQIFNEDQYGGFLIYFAPGYRVFFDDRFELYGDDLVKEIVGAGSEGTTSRVAEWQARYGRFDAALVHAGGGFEAYFDESPEEWECVNRTATAAFFVRR